MQPTTQAPSPTRNIMFAYMALCLIWGSTWLGIRILVRDVPPLEAAGVRFVISGALLIVLVVLQKRPWPRNRREWNALALLGITIMAVPYGLLFWAEQYLASSMAAILYCASPLVIALLTPLMMHRRVPRPAVFALVIAFGGILEILYNNLITSRSVMGGSAILLAVVLSAWSVVYAKTRLREIDSVTATGVQFLIGALGLLWASWILEAHRPAHWTSAALLCLVFLALFGSCIGFVLYYWLLKRMQPYQLGTSNLIVPIVAVLEGTFFAREFVPLRVLVAMSVVLVSVGSVLRAEAVADRPHDILMLREDRP